MCEKALEDASFSLIACCPETSVFQGRCFVWNSSTDSQELVKEIFIIVRITGRF